MMETKWVLQKDGTLHIGSADSYHMDICGDLLRSEVHAAGYIIIVEDEDFYKAYKDSAGYNIGSTEEQKRIVEKVAKDHVRWIKEEWNKDGWTFKYRVKGVECA